MKTDGKRIEWAVFFDSSISKETSSILLKRISDELNIKEDGSTEIVPWPIRHVVLLSKRTSMYLKIFFIGEVAVELSPEHHDLFDMLYCRMESLLNDDIVKKMPELKKLLRSMKIVVDGSMVEQHEFNKSIIEEETDKKRSYVAAKTGGFIAFIGFICLVLSFFTANPLAILAVGAGICLAGVICSLIGFWISERRKYE